VVADALRAMVPDEATAEILEEYRLLFYHGFNFWRFGGGSTCWSPPRRATWWRPRRACRDGS
jgi:hypothetical protein